MPHRLGSRFRHLPCRVGLAVNAVLLSGGLDSIALTYWKRPDHAFTIDYGQRAAATELTASAEVARTLDVQHEIIRVDCSGLGSGDMADKPTLAVAPIFEWWPFRNQLLVTLAGMRCVALGITELMIGSVATDDSHADGRSLFFDRLSALTSMQEGGLTITAPALEHSTIELVRTAQVPRDVLAWAHSCHVGPLACGACRGCTKHYAVMEELYGTPY